MVKKIVTGILAVLIAAALVMSFMNKKQDPIPYERMSAEEAAVVSDLQEGYTAQLEPNDLRLQYALRVNEDVVYYGFLSWDGEQYRRQETEAPKDLGILSCGENFATPQKPLQFSHENNELFSGAMVQKGTARKMDVYDDGRQLDVIPFYFTLEKDDGSYANSRIYTFLAVSMEPPPYFDSGAWMLKPREVPYAQMTRSEAEEIAAFRNANPYECKADTLKSLKTALRVDRKTVLYGYYCEGGAAEFAQERNPKEVGTLAAGGEMYETPRMVMQISMDRERQMPDGKIAIFKGRSAAEKMFGEKKPTEYTPYYFVPQNGDGTYEKPVGRLLCVTKKAPVYFDDGRWILRIRTEKE